MPSTSDPASSPMLALASAARPDGLVPAARLREVLHPRHIARLQAAGRLHRLWRGMYWVGGPSNDGHVPVDVRVRAAALTLRRPVAACLDTGAEILGFGPAVTDTHVITGGSSPTARSGLVVHRYRPLAPNVMVRGIPVADPAECAARLAARIGAAGAPPQELLAVLDGALRCGAIGSVETLRSRCLALGGPGVRSLCRVAALASGAAGSADDSWLRWCCFERGFDLPTINPGPSESAACDPAPLPWTDGLGHFAWPRYRATAALVPSEPPELRHSRFTVIPGPGGEWTHVRLATVPVAMRAADGCPVHPAGLGRLFAVLADGRRRAVRAGMPPSGPWPQPIFRPPRASRRVASARPASAG